MSNPNTRAKVHQWHERGETVPSIANILHIGEQEVRDILNTQPDTGQQADSGGLWQPAFDWTDET